MKSLPSNDVTLPAHKNTAVSSPFIYLFIYLFIYFCLFLQEGYLDIIFTPGYISTESIAKGLTVTISSCLFSVYDPFLS